MPICDGDSLPGPAQHRYVVGHVAEREDVRLIYSQAGRQPGQAGGFGDTGCHGLDQIRYAGVDNAEARTHRLSVVDSGVPESTTLRPGPIASATTARQAASRGRRGDGSGPQRCRLRYAGVDNAEAMGPGLSVVDSGVPDLVEAVAAGVSKATGLAWLAARLGVDQTDVLAFGDMPNDVPMLRWAGQGVAVADGHPAALAAADALTGPCAEDGVAAYLERVFT